MTADRLREAAKVLRGQIDGLTTDHARWDDAFPVSSVYADKSTYERLIVHPGVGLALADWLDLVGAWRDEGLGLMPRGNLADAWLDIERQANVLADLVLGGASRPARRTGPMSATAHIDADPSRRPALEKCSSCGHECGYHFTPDGRTIPCDADDLSPVRDCGCEQYTYLAENDADLILGAES